MSRLRNNPRCRVKDLLSVFEDRYCAAKLPNDEQGRTYLRIVLDHAALFGGGNGQKRSVWKGVTVRSKNVCGTP
jgi:hypothetical protein